MRSPTPFKIWQAPVLRVAVIYGISGLGFTGGNLLLAWALPPVDYGTLALAVALLYVSISLAPAGADNVVVRRKIEPGPPYLRRTFLTSVTVGVCGVGVAGAAYSLDVAFLMLLLAGTIAGGLAAVAAAAFQSQQRFMRSLSLSRAPDIALGAVGAAAIVFGVQGPAPLFSVLVLGLIASAIYGWRRLFIEHAAERDSGGVFAWKEALALLGVTAATNVLYQAERLVIPRVLTLEDLATYGVLAAIVGAPFRVLELSVGYTLVPRLRAADAVSTHRSLLWQEIRIVGCVMILAFVVVWIATPHLVEWLFSGKYQLTSALVLSAALAGVTKVLNGFGRAAVTALSDNRRLNHFNLFGWVSMVVAVAGGAFGSQWGLTGVVYGVALGWLLRGVAAGFLVAPALRRAQ